MSHLHVLVGGKGHIVNLSSTAGTVVSPFEAAYPTAKSGLVGATHSLRAEHRGSPAGFSVVCPGFVRQDGMYARYEAQGQRPPLLAGTTTRHKVASAVLTAIREDRARDHREQPAGAPRSGAPGRGPQVMPRPLKLTGLTSWRRGEHR
jgi:short-subunit dehydrogenase